MTDLCHYRPKGYNNGFGKNICLKPVVIIEKDSGYGGPRVKCLDGHIAVDRSMGIPCDSCELELGHGLAGIYQSLRYYDTLPTR